MLQTVVETQGAPGQRVIVVKTGASAPQTEFRASIEQRRELSRQLELLSRRRRSLADQLQGQHGVVFNKVAIESRVVELDKQIADVEEQLTETGQRMANRAEVQRMVSSSVGLEMTGPSNGGSFSPASSSSSCYFHFRSSSRDASGVAALLLTGHDLASRFS